MSEQGGQALEIKSGNVSTASRFLRVHPAIEALQSEILRHPQLVTDMRLADARGEIKTFEDGLAIVAAYADVTLHGVYGADEMGDISLKLVNRLIAKRGSLT